MTDEELARWQRYIYQRVKLDPETDCWNWQLGSFGNGYGQCGLAYKHGLSSRAHILAHQVFIGPVLESLVVRHTCHNKRCCNPNHLLIGTQSDNVNDSIRDGRSTGGNVLNAEQVSEIRRLLALKLFSQGELADLFGVSRPTIGKIANGISWPTVAPAVKEPEAPELSGPKLH